MIVDKIDSDEQVIICRKAIDSWGQAIQKVVAMEEMAELTQAISKSLRGKDHNVEEEIADVEIMVTQLKLMYDNEKVEKIKQEKLQRLERVLGNERLS